MKKINLKNIMIQVFILILSILPCSITFAFNASVVRSTAYNNGIPEAEINRIIDHVKYNQDHVGNLHYVTFVDFRKPSSEKRGLIINTDTGNTFRFLVAHGKNSGELYATRFSNRDDSMMSSIGLYTVDEVYSGKHGNSLRMRGLDSTNSNAYSREIVMHSADYVSEQFVRENGRLGLSHGCFTVSSSSIGTAISLLRDGSLLLAFH